MFKAATLTLIPKVSEKSYLLSEVNNTYTFIVPMDSNKSQIARAVETQFKVTVIKVTTQIQKGKVKRAYKKRGSFVDGVRSDKKKALVTVAKGDKIKIFEETA